MYASNVLLERCRKRETSNEGRKEETKSRREREGRKYRENGRRNDGEIRDKGGEEGSWDKLRREDRRRKEGASKERQKGRSKILVT
jgi:hypothetical protein